MASRQQRQHRICRLGDVMYKLGITQQELAEITGLSQSHISKVINGADLYLSTAQTIAKAVGKKVDYLWPNYDWVEVKRYRNK